MGTITKERLAPVTIHRRGRFRFTAQVTPDCGANLVSFAVDGTELLFWDPKGLIAGRHHSGAFNMFPTPCRLADCRYVFKGRRIRQRKGGEDVFIHGLVRDEPFRCHAEADSVTSWVDIATGHPAFEGFPFPCRFMLTHALERSGLVVRYQVKNRGTRSLPFGYGIHPYWRIHGRRDDLRVRIPCPYVLESRNLVPTGGYVPAGEQGVDLRELRSMQRFHSDHVYWPRQPGAAAEVVWRTKGLRMTIEASDEFRHMIAYAPPRRRFVCVESLTCSPNAPNLASAGHADVAGLQIVKPGGVAEGWVRYRVERLRTGGCRSAPGDRS